MGYKLYFLSNEMRLFWGGFFNTVQNGADFHRESIVLVTCFPVSYIHTLLALPFTMNGSKAVENAEKKDTLDENLTYEQSEIRLIGLGCIAALCLLTCATAFMLITHRISGYHQDPIVLEYSTQNQLGFAMPKLLLMDHSGNFKVYDPHANTLKKLPNLKKVPKAKHIYSFALPEGIQKYKIFSAEYGHNLYFMYSDQSTNVIRYNLDTQTHRIIPQSPSINSHNGDCSGVQIGKYFWIILGEDLESHYDTEMMHFFNKPQFQSSLWHLEKQQWFEGPSFQHLPTISPEMYARTDYCIVSVGMNTAYFLIDVYLLAYSFDTFQWTNQSVAPLGDIFNWYSLAFPTCAFYQDKLYHRYIYVTGKVESYESMLRWEIMRYSLDTNTWITIDKYSSTEKYYGLMIPFQGNLIQMFQSDTLENLEITQIIPETYTQSILFKKNTVEFDPFLENERYHTISVFYSRDYI